MLKGKTISPRKQSVEKILANQEISDIIKVIGGGFDKTFDVDKMQFDKIVITSDADSDGASIELLLTTFFFTYMRPLVEAGKLYRAVTPLYIIRQKNNEYYAYTDEELEEWKSQHQGTYELVRAKG
jgi:DNA gyrase/topoisomerase IV subunit B